MNPRQAYDGDVEIARFLTMLVIVAITTCIIFILKLPSALILIPLGILFWYPMWLLKKTIKRFISHWIWLLKGAPKEQVKE